MAGRAIAVDAGNAEAHRVLAMVHLRACSLDEAMRHCLRSVRGVPATLLTPLHMQMSAS